MSSKVDQKREWKTKNLDKRLAADAMAAGTAGLTIAPIVSMIDK